MNPRNSTLIDRICHVWQKIKYTIIFILLQFSVIVHLTENELIAQNALNHCHCMFLFCVYRQQWPLSVIVCISNDKFQNFRVGVFILVFCSLMSCLIFKHEVLDIYLEIFLWWVAIFLPPLIAFILIQTINFPILIPIQSCLRPTRICLNPHFDSTPIVDNSIYIVYTILVHMLLTIFFHILLNISLSILLLQPPTADLSF